MGNHQKKKKKERDKFSPSEKALQLPNSTLEGKGRGKFTLSQKTEEMALFGIFKKLLLP